MLLCVLCYDFGTSKFCVGDSTSIIVVGGINQNGDDIFNIEVISVETHFLGKNFD